MRVLGYTIEFTRNAARTLSQFERQRDWRTGNAFVGWWKFVVRYGRTNHCEECGIVSDFEEYCYDCYELHFCECGVQLCDAYGSPGDGLCRKCA